MAQAPHPAGRDPRLAAREADIRPTVAPPPRGVPVWMIVTGFALAGLLLFVLLDSRRRALTAPATRAQASDAYGRAAATPPGLFVPPLPEPKPTPIVVRTPPPVSYPIPRAPVTFVPRQVQPPIYYPPPSNPIQPAQPATPPRSNTESPLVYDVVSTDGAAATGPNAAAVNPATGGGAERVRAGVIRNASTTVPQGTMIPAVLETALDSTRPGLARALVQRDVRGFDGKEVLIQRGSRLIGQYRADLAPGQNRASVMWTRLVRPDGVTIALQSPAADTLGRGGIKGKVDTHFFARFGAAILQSTLDVGVALASRIGTNNTGVIIAPGIASSATQGLTGNANQVQPTLTVRQGTAITVFVARDLDFTGVESAR